jgi:hypothetical protein
MRTRCDPFRALHCTVVMVPANSGSQKKDRRAAVHFANRPAKMDVLLQSPPAKNNRPRQKMVVSFQSCKNVLFPSARMGVLFPFSARMGVLFPLFPHSAGVAVSFRGVSFPSVATHIDSDQIRLLPITSSRNNARS